MKGVTMLFVIQLTGVLLLISATVATDLSIQQPLGIHGDRQGMERLEVLNDVYEGSAQTPLRARPPNRKWKKNPVFCCVCQDVVIQTKPKIDLKIQKKINEVCGKFIPMPKKRCLLRGLKIKTKILKTLFPGRTPKETCRKVNLCMY